MFHPQTLHSITTTYARHGLDTTQRATRTDPNGPRGSRPTASQRHVENVPLTEPACHLGRPLTKGQDENSDTWGMQ